MTCHVKNFLRYFSQHQTHLLLISKKIKIRYNSNPLLIKSFRKEIIVRSKLRNKFSKYHTSINWQNYKKRRNKCVKKKQKTLQPLFMGGVQLPQGQSHFEEAVKHAKIHYFNKLNFKSIMDTKKFQFEMPSNPSFPMKVNPQKTSPALKNKRLKYLLKEFQNLYIKKIQNHFNNKEKFTFREFQRDEIIKIIKELPKNKASTFKDILVKIMVNQVHIYVHSLAKIFNDCVKSMLILLQFFKTLMRQTKITIGIQYPFSFLKNI